MPLQLDDLGALDEPIGTTSGSPLSLPVERIEEDPEQPRREFESNALQELAATIRERGIRQPVSVRPNPHRDGWWILNFGARRLRAARIAGLHAVPAFVDTTADSYDQVIENEQREGLTPLELALFVQKRLAGGDNQAEIARRLGKSRAYVTLATALIEPPDWLLDAYRSGKCRGIAELYELRRLHGRCPAEVESYVASRETLTRQHIAELKAVLAPSVEREVDRPVSAAERGRVPEQANEEVLPTQRNDTNRRGPSLSVDARTNRGLHVEFEGQDYQLVVSVSPKESGCFFVKPLNGGPRRVAQASALTLRGFVGA